MAEVLASELTSTESSGWTALQLFFMDALRAAHDLIDWAGRIHHTGLRPPLLKYVAPNT